MRDTCKGRPASAGIKSQIKRIKNGLHPYYRATTKDLTLSLPGPLSAEDREALSQSEPADAAPAQAASEGGRPAPDFVSGSGYASQDVVLAAFGLRREDLERVEALGEASRRGGSDEGSDSASLDDEVF